MRENVMDGTERVRREECGTMKQQQQQPHIDIWKVEYSTKRTERWQGTAEEMEQFGVDGLIWASNFKGKRAKE